MGENTVDRKEAYTHLEDVKSLLKEKESFKDTNEYKEAQKIINEVKKVVNSETREKYMDKYPQRAIIKLKKAKKILEELDY